MQILGIAFLLSCSVLSLSARPSDSPQPDSYAIAPSLDESEEADLNLAMAPPDVNASPHIYYMDADGIAKPAEILKPAKVFKREVANSGNGNKDETLETAETVIIGPPSGRPFGYPALHLGYRQGHAYYSGRFHKYPWNYH